MRRHKYILGLAGIMGFIVFHACQKEELFTGENAHLQFSEDTVYFDTVLATLGSVTEYLLIYNPYDQPLQVDRIFLAEGSGSYFRLNLDGERGSEFRKIRIAAKDSLFVFIEVTIDPLNDNNPMLIRDSLVFQINSNSQDVKLMAYGQDVHVYNGEIFKTQTWTAEKPYLIVNNAAIDSNEVLMIGAGTHVYLTNTSSLVVWGRIEAVGTYEDPIVFTGARFDGRYEETAGQWGTIYIDEKSTGNLMEYVIIKNATAGLQVGYPGNETVSQIELRNCMILNSASIGIYAFNGTIDAYNTIVADCGAVALLAQMGGSYNFYHCTISNVSAYYPESFYEGGYKYRILPSVIFSNYFDWYDLDMDYRVIEVTYPIDLEINFTNSIIYGNRSSEVYYDSLNDAGLEYNFRNCLLKIHEDSISYFDTLKFVATILNEDPVFINDSISLDEYNFELDSASPAINAGDWSWIEGIPQLEYDFKGNPRKEDNNPDLGAFEHND